MSLTSVDRCVTVVTQPAWLIAYFASLKHTCNYLPFLFSLNEIPLATMSDKLQWGLILSTSEELPPSGGQKWCVAFSFSFVIQHRVVFFVCGVGWWNWYLQHLQRAICRWKFQNEAFCAWSSVYGKYVSQRHAWCVSVTLLTQKRVCYLDFNQIKIGASYNIKSIYNCL